MSKEKWDMAIRFTEFIRHDNQDVNLYIVQENQASENLCFRVYVKDGESAELSLCKIEEHNWKISPQEIPQWLNDIKPLVVSAIENKLVQRVVHKRIKS